MEANNQFSGSVRIAIAIERAACIISIGIIFAGVSLARDYLWYLFGPAVGLTVLFILSMSFDEEREFHGLFVSASKEDAEPNVPNESVSK